MVRELKVKSCQNQKLPAGIFTCDFTLLLCPIPTALSVDQG
jgi:hypothetical protein